MYISLYLNFYLIININNLILYFDLFFFLIIESKCRKNYIQKECECVACEKMKTRKNVIIFVKEHFNSELDVVRKVIGKCNESDRKNKVMFLCLTCKKKLLGLQKTKGNKEISNVDEYYCTCCHNIFRQKYQVVFFKKVNYDFTNEKVKFALSDEVRMKKYIYEFICKSCHRYLNKRNGIFVKIPKNAYCYIGNSEKSNDTFKYQNYGKREKGNNYLEGNQYWNNILSTMSRKKSFDDLKVYVDEVVLPSIDRNFKGMTQLNSDMRDYLTKTILPNDIGVSNDDLFPVFTSGAGSCLYYALSRIVYGDESHCVEMRVRIVIEGVRNMQFYIDHNYLCRGYDFPHALDIELPQVYVVYLNLSQSERELSREDVQKYYEKEMVDMTKFSCESGLWQLHQAANVVGCRIQSVYPYVNENFNSLRTDCHRMILPVNVDNDERILRLMWTKGSWLSSRFGHFVPLVERNRSLGIVDVNLPPNNLNMNKNTNVVVDLTTNEATDIVDCAPVDKITSVNEQSEVLNKSYYINSKRCDFEIVDNDKVIGNEDMSNVDASESRYWENISGKTDEIICTKKAFLCTCCHHQISTRSNVKIFEKCRYDFNNDIIQSVLSNVYRCKDTNDIEYICMPCHNSLILSQPEIPILCAMNKGYSEAKIIKNNKNIQLLCTSCHRNDIEKKKVMIFSENEFDFDHRIVKEVLSDKYRKKSNDEVEYICMNCYSKLKMCKLPVNSAYNRENIELMKKCIKMENRKKNEENILIEKAGEKFLRSCKEMPEYICTCCHRVLFRKTVDVFRRDKYKDTGIVKDVLSERYRYRDIRKDEEYICQTCSKDLKQGKMPAQAVANGLEVPDIPIELNGLTRLEVRCIGLRIPFMTLTALPKGKRGKIRGACVNVPATLEPIAQVLPRVPENMDLVILKFKRIIVSKNNYISDYIRPYKVMNALRWLKEHNPHYSHVKIDNDWLKKFEEHDLFDSILPESSDCIEESSVNVESEMEKDCSDNATEDNKNEYDIDNKDSEDEEDDKQFIEDVKENERKSEITIGSTATCVQFENPDEVAFSIAPGQNAIPQFILMDNDFEVLAFPNLFPYGNGGFEVLRPRVRELNLRRYVNQRLLNKDGRFGQNIEYIFAFQYATELKQLRSDMSMALKRCCSDGRKITVGDMRNFQKVNSFIWKDIAYKFMKKVRGTPAYWQVQLYDTLAMLRTFGTPTWFVSFSPAEFMWPEFMQAVGKRNGYNWSEDDVAHMDWITKAEHFRVNAVTVDQMFENRIESFFKDFILSKAKPLGDIIEHVEKIEFQVRGTPHAHCLLWVKDAPRVDINSDEEVCQFVDKYINGMVPSDIPENEDIRDLVLKLQTHRHNACCRKGGRSVCRFNFPRPPTTKTVIARSVDCSSPTFVDEKDRKHILHTVHERIDKQDGASLSEILESECIPEEKYLNCLRSSVSRGTNIILKRDTSDCNTNNCNLNCLRLWRANMDIQYVADPYSCIMYVLSYVMKCENGMSEILKRVGKEFKDQVIQDQMKKILSTFANKREVSIHEAVKRVLSQWLFRKSRTVVYVANHPSEQRHRMPKSGFDLAGMDDDDENVFMSSIHDLYASRPDELEDLCLAQFATQYHKSDIRNKKAMVLKDKSLGCIIKRSKDAILRTHRFSDDDYRFYYSKLLLFLPWRKENEMIGEYQSYEHKYNAKKDVIEQNASPFNMNQEETIDNALDQYMHHPVSVSDWLVETSGENSDDNTDENAAENVGVNCHDDGNKVKKDTPLSLKYKAEAIKPTISAEEYCVMMRNLNKEQREIVIFNRIWMKECIVKMRLGKDYEGYKIFLSGSGGCGKSYVIKMIQRDNVYLFRNYYARCGGDDISDSCEDIVTLVSAYTGTAAFNINGITLHSAFQLGGRGRGISDEKKTTLRTQLHRLQQLTIDEISLVGQQIFNEVNSRCCMIKHTDANKQNFGNINVLVVGDLYQLPPVMQKQIYFKSYNNAMSASDLAPSLWDNFMFHELTQVMRQKDVAFADMLNQVRVGTPEQNSEVDKMLKARELNISEEDDSYPNDVLHVYAENRSCRVRNRTMLNKIDGQLYVSCAHDRIEDIKLDMSDIDISHLSATDTGNLEQTLTLKVGARVFVSNNIDVADGLTNGVFGTVSHVITSRHNTLHGEGVEEVRVVLVRFDAERVGKEAKAKSAFKRLDPNAVPISRIETTFCTRKNGGEKNKKQIRVIRKQFPLILAWAVTIHKVQGMTMDQIVVDMSRDKGKYQKGQAYVALSRVKTYNGLHIINYDRHQIKADGKVRAEMERLRNEKSLPVTQDAMIWNLPSDCLRLVHLNVQGLNYKGRTKQIDIHMDREIQEVDIICFTETHFQRDDIIDMGFFWLNKTGTLYRKEREERKGGGVAIVVSDRFTSRNIDIVSVLEVVGIEVFCPDRTIILCIYIPPSVSKVAAVFHLRKIIEKLLENTCRIVVVGDFNEDLLISNGSKLIKSCFDSLGFDQHVKQATTDYGSILDHVYSRSVYDVGIDVQDTYYSDHDRVFCFLK